MNLSVAPSSARRSKRRLSIYAAKRQQLEDEVEESISRMLVATLERELPAFIAGFQNLQGLSREAA